MPPASRRCASWPHDRGTEPACGGGAVRRDHCAEPTWRGDPDGRAARAGGPGRVGPGVCAGARPRRAGRAGGRAGRRPDRPRSLSRRQCAAYAWTNKRGTSMNHKTFGHSIGRRTAPLTRVAAVAAPAVVRAQGEPIKIATLTPLTGAGGPYGPTMAKAAAAVVEAVNSAGGVLGRKVVLVSEDDQTSPEPAVRAARKLIDVDKVSAIMGTWASSVTTAVAPLCWESKTPLFTVS